MRTRLPSLAAASLVLAACSSDTTTGSTTSTSGTESTPSSESATGSVDETPTDTTATGTRAARATLDPQRLETCTAEAALLAGAPDVAVTLEPTLGGCALVPPATPAAGEPNALELNVLGGASRVAEVVRCAPGRTPTVDFSSHSYATFTSVHRVSEDWRVVFAVDDGDKIHVGIRLGRNCQAATATTAPETRAFDVAGRGRSIVVHRCEPRSDPPQIPPVCP